jgi:hypothetical protein
VGENRPSEWEIVEDDDGFANIHEPRDEGHLGDIIATVWNDDHAHLIAAAPDLLECARMLAGLQCYAPDGRPDGRRFPSDDQCAFAAAAIAKATTPTPDQTGGK